MVFFWCGYKYHNFLLRNIGISDASKFDNKNRLRVTPELLLVGEQNIYAIGDCCNTSEEKLASHACAHARTVAHNIWRDIKGKTKKPYVQSKFIIIS